ncbi:hypothetical protein P152DRAFT_471388 [Eremomyces bilateralis CBS 781.70]|uniref:Uncharacterized protein n=1 Tax=Eremomyces bilateralis CBS 781.70 TaxID=1392243 RepID=A0A6G1G9X3_9PEZI|nr:uncharacterized protein P152DRAFT_471388 [Eremomyces bilateralis CBS 781.70]KAF1814710.1 hypothetical protein P152DRAFT_471388 [Eremomyces bilateralis CBS 781.70]
MSNPNTPDLAQILRDLAAYQPDPQPSQTAPPYGTSLNTSANGSHSLSAPSISSFQQQYPSQSFNQPESSQAARVPSHTNVSSNCRPYEPGHSSSQRESQILGDASSITEWGPGLRHVSRLAALNPEFERTVKQLMADQQTHEVEWFNGREALLAKQASRDENTTKLDAIFRSIGGSIAPSAPMNPQEKEVELRQYDKKVYKASQDMYSAFSVRLERLGVPFFSGNRDGPSPLQEKMIKHLEDMFGDLKA